MMSTYTNFEALPLTLTAMDVAKALGISRVMAYELLNSPGFPTLRIGKRIMVPKDQFIGWIQKSIGDVS